MTIESELPMALRAAYLSLHRASDTVFAKYGVTADQFVLLATLKRGRAMTQRELARRMSSDPSTLRAMIVLLEQIGLVQRNSHPTDSRARTVELTLVGIRKFRQLWRAGESIRQKMYQELGINDSKVLVELLTRVSNTLNETSVRTGRSIKGEV